MYHGHTSDGLGKALRRGNADYLSLSVKRGIEGPSPPVKVQIDGKCFVRATLRTKQARKKPAMPRKPKKSAPKK